MLGIIIYNITEIVKEKKIKRYILNIILEFSVAFVLLLVALIGMAINGNLVNFIDYTVVGIKEFNINLGIEDPSYILNSFLQLIFFFILTIIYKIFVKIEEEEKRNINFIIIIGICCYFIQYPVFNGYHYVQARFIMTIYLIYIIQNFLLKNNLLYKKEKITKTIISISTIAIVIIATIQITQYNNKLKQMENNIYYGVEMSQEQKEDIELMCNYIITQKEKGIDVKVVSYRAMAYMTPLKLNNKEFDLPFIGNLGYAGENGLIEKISKLENTKILITKDEDDKIYQESTAVRNYIINNLELVGEIGDFMIYNSTVFNK